MTIYELVIEITRRCNIKCRHCLRGPAQKIDINNTTIDKLLEGVTFISCVTFTGGEPSLAADRIRYFTKRVKALGIEVGSFFVISNGKRPSLDLATALIELRAYCSDNEVSGLVISQDQFHEEVVRPGELDDSIEFYKGLSFFREDDYRNPIHEPINEGYARRTGLGMREADLETLNLGFNDDDQPESCEGTVYVNVHGDVVPGCIFSYLSQKREKIGNVHEKTLSQILLERYRYLETLPTVESKVGKAA